MRKWSYTRSIYRQSSHFEKSLRELVTKGKLAGDLGDKCKFVCVACVADPRLLNI